GGWTLGAAEAVCGGAAGGQFDVLDGLASLVEKSLVQSVEGGDGEPRFQLLETIREFGLEQLQLAGEEAERRQRHAAYYTALAEAAEPELRGPRQGEWLDRLEQEQDNLRAALTWAQTSEAGQ